MDNRDPLPPKPATPESATPEPVTPEPVTPEPVTDDALRAALKEHARQALKNKVKHLVRARLGCGAGDGAVGEGWFPLSHGQEALWFLAKLAPDSPTYTVALPVGVSGQLDIGLLRQALDLLARRHPCLRLEFREDATGLRQRARADASFRLEVEDATGWDDARVAARLAARARQPFRLDVDATPVALLLRRGPQEHALLLALPHIACDLWSLVVVMDELRAVYTALAHRQPPDLPETPVTFEDWVRAERRAYPGAADPAAPGNREADPHWVYWRARLAGELPVLDLPTDHRRPPVQTFRGATHIHQVPAADVRALKRYAQSQGATLFMALLAAYQVLLHRYSGQDGVMVGTPTAGRRRPGLNGLVGNLVNMVALRADLAGAPSFRQVLAQARTAVLGALEHQDLPFSVLVDRLHPARDLSRPPVFQTTFVLQRFHRYPALQDALLPAGDEPPIPFGPLHLRAIPLHQQDGQYDLNLEMKEDGAGRLMGAWKYAADLFDDTTVAHLAASFTTLLRHAVAEPDRPVEELPLLDPDEKAQALAAGRGPVIPLPPSPTIHALFQERARQGGGRVAVAMGDRTLSYAALAERVDRLAATLAGLGVGPETLVAVALPRGPDFIAALLAVGAAGGAFLPLDLRQPPSRLAAVLAQSGARLALAENGLHAALRAALAEVMPDLPAVSLLDPSDSLARDSLKSAPRKPQPAFPSPPDGGTLAYVMYTSGSTGRPKGVMVEHRGMVNHILAKLEDLGIGPDDALAQNAPPSFDVVAWQCLAPLVVGARVVVVPNPVAEDPARLLAETARQGVSVLQVVPALLRALIAEAETAPGGPPALPRLRWMVPTGEALPADLCRRWRALYPQVPLLNTYGSTECSDDQCHDPIGLAPRSGDDATAIAAIGRPIRNMTAHVLDRALAPVPAGVVGELHIGGLGVGRGYRGDPARTAASFIPDPHSPEPGARLYRTRDLARRRADGRLDFLGRVDDMVKLRGLRIEPGEIEAALCRHPGVAQAAVRACPHPTGEPRLVAYIVSAPNHLESLPDEGELRAFLAGLLPQAMIPAQFLPLATLPLTPNGKLDHRRLPSPVWEGDTTPPTPPRTPLEEALVALWAEVLGHAQVGVFDDFFAIGGDSIRSIQVCARGRTRGLTLNPGDLFLHRTVAALAALPGLAGLTPAPPPDAAARPPDTLAGVLADAAILERALQQVRFDEP